MDSQFIKSFSLNLIIFFYFQCFKLAFHRPLNRERVSWITYRQKDVSASLSLSRFRAVDRACRCDFQKLSRARSKIGITILYYYIRLYISRARVLRLLANNNISRVRKGLQIRISLVCMCVGNNEVQYRAVRSLFSLKALFSPLSKFQMSKFFAYYGGRRVRGFIRFCIPVKICTPAQMCACATTIAK